MEIVLFYILGVRRVLLGGEGRVFFVKGVVYIKVWKWWKYNMCLEFKEVGVIRVLGLNVGVEWLGFVR